MTELIHHDNAIGEEQYGKFVKEKLADASVPLYDAIKKNNLQLWQSQGAGPETKS